LLVRGTVLQEPMNPREALTGKTRVLRLNRGNLVSRRSPVARGNDDEPGKNA
jgi:hypothetical protein